MGLCIQHGSISAEEDRKIPGLASAIEENGYKCFNTSLEIGTREVINQRNWAVLNLL